jgi:hypothetical protein
MRFPRVLKKGLPSTYKSVQMHVFADASKVCFAAVAYIRIEYLNGTFHTNFVMAKSSINPVSPVKTIPKLELMAVDKAVRLALHVNKPLNIEMTETFIWTDSKTALQWLAMPEGNLQVLPHNYCKKIKEGMHDLRQVCWVQGVENPADIPTRPKTLKKITTDLMRKVWIAGPLWLRTDPSNWPKLPILEKTEAVMEGMKKEFKVFEYMTPNTENAMVLGITMNCLVLQHRDFLDINLYSNLRPLKRILAHVFHFIKRVRQRLDRKQLGIEVPKLIVPQKLSKRHYPKSGLMDQEDYAEAHIRLVHLHHRRYLSDETKRIEDKASLALSSKFAKLGPVLVPHRGLRLGPSQTPIQILRLGGRIHQADHLADSARLPFLLHPADHFTTLIV